MFLLFPGEWHTYTPDKETGWNEYWIGFDGKIMENWEKNGFFSLLVYSGEATREDYEKCGMTVDLALNSLNDILPYL